MLPTQTSKSNKFTIEYSNSTHLVFTNKFMDISRDRQMQKISYMTYLSKTQQIRSFKYERFKLMRGVADP